MGRLELAVWSRLNGRRRWRCTWPCQSGFQTVPKLHVFPETVHVLDSPLFYLAAIPAAGITLPLLAEQET